jgi:ketol-acid reductoisomerase
MSNEVVEKKDIKTILKLIGETTPVEAIIQNYSENPESVELRSEQKELEQGTIQLAKLMFESLQKSGVSNEIATKQILNIEPFNEYSQIIEYLN